MIFTRIKSGKKQIFTTNTLIICNTSVLYYYAHIKYTEYKNYLILLILLIASEICIMDFHYIRLIYDQIYETEFMSKIYYLLKNLLGQLALSRK